MTTYQENTAKVENASIPQQEAAYVIDVGFGADVHEKEADKTMHGNLVYDMVDDVAPEEDYLPDPEVYEAARRIDEERWFYRFVKRAFDIVFSATVLFLFCWLYIIIAIAIKIDDPKGPVIFKQERVGKNGERFMMWKFRSMYVDAEAQLDNLMALNEKTGPVFKISKDPRVASRIIDATARRSSFGPAVASVFPPKMTEISAVFSQVKQAICNLRNLLKNSFKNLLTHTPATTNFFAERNSAPISWGGGLPMPCHCESMAA